MASDKELIIKIGILDEFSKKFENISKGIKGSSLTKMGGQLKETGSWMTTRITAPFALIAGLSLKAASRVEELTDAVELFTKSTEETEKVLKDIEGLSLNKIFKAEEIEGVAQKLLRAGVSTKDLAKNMEMLGNISVGSKMPLEELSSMYATTMHRGKLSERALIMMGRAGIPVADTIAKMANTSKEAITKLAQKGSLGASILDEAFKNLTENNGRYFGQIEKNAKDLDSIYIQLLNSLNNVFKSIGDVIKGLVKEIGPTVIEALNKFAIWIKTFASENPMITKIIVALAALTAIIGPLIFALGALVSSLSGLFVLLAAFNIVSVTSMTTAFSGMAMSIGAVALAVGKLMAAFGAGYAIGEGINWLDEKIGKLLGSSEGFMSKGIQSSMSGISKLFGGTGIMSDEEAFKQAEQQFKLKKATLAIPPKGEKGKSDINIKISAPEWLQSNVTGIRSNGKGDNVNFMTESYLGPSFDLPGVR